MIKIKKPTKIYKGYRFKLYPTQAQKSFFEETFGACRFVWNFGLEVRKDAYINLGINLNFNDCSKGLTQIKKLDNCRFLKKVNSQSINQELRNLDSSYLKFFKRIGGFPKFKSKNDKQSFEVPQYFKYNTKFQELIIPKLKTPIKVNQHRNFGQNFEIRSLFISKNKSGEYFVSFRVLEDAPTKKFTSNNKVGIDLGLTDLMVFSNGTKIQNPRIAKKYRKKLAYYSRQFSKKTKDSCNFNKFKLKIAKLHNKISNIKLDFTHKLTSKIISENQVICMEDLAISNMMKNHKLARSIQEVSWGEIVRQLKYKAEWYGRKFVQTNAFFPSSKTCSNDGYILEKLPLNIRSWTCPKCGETHDRDINAAKNILKQGLNILSDCGTQSDVKQKRGEPLRRTLAKVKGDIKAMNFEAPRSLA